MKPSTGNRNLWLAAMRQRTVWMRVLKVGLPVGVLQAVLNQGDVWYHHQATGLTLFKTLISPLVTSSVALVSAAATWTGLFRLRSVHAKWTSVEIVIVEGFNSRIQLGLVAEGHESETLGLSGLAIGDDFDPFDRSKSGKETSDVSFSSSVGQVAHVDIHCLQFL